MKCLSWPGSARVGANASGSAPDRSAVSLMTAESCRSFRTELDCGPIVELAGADARSQRQTKPHIIASIALFCRTLWFVCGEERVVGHTGTTSPPRPRARMCTHGTRAPILHTPRGAGATEKVSLSAVTNRTLFGPQTKCLKLISLFRGRHEITQPFAVRFHLRRPALPGGAPR